MFRGIQISFGFVVLICFFYFFDSENLLPYILCAVLVHEGGHILAVRRFGAGIAEIRVGAVGINIRTYECPMLSYGQEIVTALAGSAANLMAAVLSSFAGKAIDGAQALFVFAGVNVVMGAFNLIPLPEMDGGRAAYFLFVLLTDRPATAYKISKAIGVATFALVFAAGTMIFVISGYKNISMCLVGLYLAFKQMCGDRLKKLAQKRESG